MDLYGLPQKIQINRALSLRGKDKLARVATLRNMMGNTNCNHTS